MPHHDVNLVRPVFFVKLAITFTDDTEGNYFVKENDLGKSGRSNTIEIGTYEEINQDCLFPDFYNLSYELIQTMALIKKAPEKVRFFANNEAIPHHKVKSYGLSAIEIKDIEELNEKLPKNMSVEPLPQVDSE